MKKYAIRSAKYFIALCVLCTAIMALNYLTGMAKLSVGEFLYVMFHTTRGLLLPAAIVLLALLYPKFDFVTRRTEGDMQEDREQVLNAFRMAGFSLRREEEGVMVFRADSFLRKLTLLWEDEIKVSQYGQWIAIEGIRRGVVRAQYLLDSYLQMKKRNEE